MAVTGKVILKVKSGPGTLIGEVEGDIIDDQVFFSNLKFSDPGDYVISVTSTSTFVEVSEFSIKVMPSVIDLNTEQSQTNPKTEEKKPDEPPKPIITQVDQAKVDLPPMSFDRTGNNKDDKLVTQQVGLTPFINYMGSPINDRDIISLRLSHDGIIPVIQFSFIDTNGLIKTIGMPQDDTKFEFFLNSRSSNLKSIHLKFKIEEFNALSNNSYSIYGTLDISELYRIKYESYTGTSYEILRKIAGELKLGFNSNITNTDDKMIWRNVGDKQYTFIEDVIKHSYSNDKSFMVGFIDYYYCFNYIDVQKEMDRDNTNDKMLDTSFYDDNTKETDRIMPLLLISDKSFNNSSSFIVEKSFENNSTQVSINKGYKTKTKYYDKTKKQFLVFDVDATTSDQSNTMVLKGANGDKEAFDNNISTTYTGKIDTDNVHKNYNYAVTQNKINLTELSKIVLKVDLPNPNYSIYLYQKINISIVNQGAQTPTNKDIIQWRKSGNYIISELNFNWNGKSLNQELVLIRKELGKNPAEISEGPPPTTPQAAETKTTQNENPTDTTNLVTQIEKANSSFNVNEIYTVETSTDDSQTPDNTNINTKIRYFLTVTNVLENGTEITGKVSKLDKDANGNIILSSFGADFLFNVEKVGFVKNDKLGDLYIVGPGEIYDTSQIQGTDDVSISPEYVEESFQGSEELALELEKLQDIQSEPFDEPISASEESISRVEDINIDFNSSKFVGGKWKSFNIEKLINLLPGYKPNSKFKDSLKKVLYFIKNDPLIDDVRKAAYLLGTAYAESGYSLQRWEADYACTGAGVKYGPNGPCSSALNYYRSTKGGKKNYYTLGTDSKGFPYFGRGLIQLTGKANYEKYGDLIGVNLVGNGDLAIQEQNSYKIAVQFMRGRVFSHVLKGDLKTARKRVNGGTKGINEVNGAYKAWLDAFNSIAT